MDPGAVSLNPTLLASLRSLKMDDEPGFLKTLITAFLSDTQLRLSRICEAVNAGDAAAVERNAHALKGSSGNMGAMKLCGTMAALMELARRGAWEGARELAESADREFLVVEDLLQKELL